MIEREFAHYVGMVVPLWMTGSFQPIFCGLYYLDGNVFKSVWR